MPDAVLDAWKAAVNTADILGEGDRQSTNNRMSEGISGSGKKNKAG